MKHLHTTENQMMHVIESLACRVTKEEVLPGKQTISNILGYARALEVIKKRNGEALFLVGN